MANETNQRPGRSGKKIRRVRIGFNVLAQIVLVLFLAAMVNSIAFKHYARWDFSRDQKYALSDKTKRFLDTLKGKMRITVFFPPNTPISTDVQNLLTEYQYAGKGKVDIEQIDPERNLSRAKELFDKYKVVTDEPLLIVDYEARNKTVKKTLGYVLGHKEPPLAEASAISVLKTFIENENIQFKELNLLDLDAIPEDVKTVMIIGPQYDFSDREMKVLRNFWDKQGRILLLLDPTAKTSKLDAFVNELGVKVNDDRLMVYLRTGIQELALTRDVQARFLGDSPITKRLADVRALFLGGTSSLTLEPDRVRAANTRLEPLIQAEKGYFAETDYNTDNQAKLQEDAKRNSNTALTIGAAIEKGGSADERVQVNSSRLVVVSNATFVQDNAITQDQQGLDFISGSVNWLLSREQLIGIAPKVSKPLTFSLDQDALARLRWIILIFMPLIPAVIGTVVWWQRRV